MLNPVISLKQSWSTRNLVLAQFFGDIKLEGTVPLLFIMTLSFQPFKGMIYLTYVSCNWNQYTNTSPQSCSRNKQIIITTTSPSTLKQKHKSINFFFLLLLLFLLLFFQFFWDTPETDQIIFHKYKKQ